MGWYYLARGVADFVKGELASPVRSDEDYLLPDERARQRVCRELDADPDIDARDVVIQVLSGALKLSGSVPTESMKARAGQRCANVPGVTSVENALTVR